MFTKTEILKILRKNKSRLEKLGVAGLGIFGSYVHNNQNEDSDIDILIDFNEKDENFDNYIGVCELIEILFKGKKVDIVTKNGLSQFIGPYILKEVEYV